MKTDIGSAIVAVLCLGGSANALGQFSIWDGGGFDSSWSNALNWAAEMTPSPGDEILIVQNVENPEFDTNMMVVDTGMTTQVGTFTFSHFARFDVTDGGSSSNKLSFAGDVINQNPAADDIGTFSIDVVVAADNITFNAGSSRLVFYKDVKLGTFHVSAAGDVEIEGALFMDINSVSDYATIGSVAASDTLTVGGNYTGNFGDVFDLTSGNFLSLTSWTLPSLSGGLSWDDSAFQSAGELRVVPEPSAVCLAGLGMLVWALRRRS